MICGYCNKKIKDKINFSNVFTKRTKYVLCSDCKEILAINKQVFKGYSHYYFAHYNDIKEEIYNIKYFGDVKTILKFKYLFELFFKHHKYDLICYIPSNITRTSIRGFDTVELICTLCNIPTKNIFEKQYREKQSKLHKTRKLNKQNMIPIKSKAFINIKSILIIDDIFTSGMTLLSYAREVEKYFPKIKISFLTLANA